MSFLAISICGCKAAIVLAIIETKSSSKKLQKSVKAFRLSCKWTLVPRTVLLTCHLLNNMSFFWLIMFCLPSWIFPAGICQSIWWLRLPSVYRGLPSQRRPRHCSCSCPSSVTWSGATPLAESSSTDQVPRVSVPPSDAHSQTLVSLHKHASLSRPSPNSTNQSPSCWTLSVALHRQIRFMNYLWHRHSPALTLDFRLILCSYLYSHKLSYTTQTLVPQCYIPLSIVKYSSLCFLCV